MKKVLLLTVCTLFLTACGVIQSFPEEDNVKVVNDDKQKLVEDSNVKITYIRIEKSTDEDNEERLTIKFEVENKLDDTITIQANEVSSDGVMVNEDQVIMSNDISGGKRGIVTLDILEEGFEMPKLKEYLEVELDVFYEETYDDINYYPLYIEL